MLKQVLEKDIRSAIFYFQMGSGTAAHGGGAPDWAGEGGAPEMLECAPMGQPCHPTSPVGRRKRVLEHVGMKSALFSNLEIKKLTC